jgi:hypothetical protein
MTKFYVVHTDQNGERHQIGDAFEAATAEHALDTILIGADEADDGRYEVFVAKELPLCRRRDMIVTHAWETWTKNGLGLDDDMREQTTKTVQDAVNNTYVDDIDDGDWLSDTLNRLRGSKQA